MDYKTLFNNLIIKYGLIPEAEKILEICEGDYRSATEMIQEFYKGKELPLVSIETLYAAEQWQVSNKDALDLIEAAIKAGILSAHFSLKEFKDFIQLVKNELDKPIPTPPNVKEDNQSVQPKTQPRKIIKIPQRQPRKLPSIPDEIDVHRFLVYGFWALCLISFALIFFTPKISQTEKPSVTLYPTFTEKQLHDAACRSDLMNNVPVEYSRCFDNPTPPPDNEPIDPYACPYGCSSHKVGCDIKGNIAFDTQEKIYHLPGQKYYSNTTIDPAYGEAWFCTEEEAISNGWRKAYQ